MIHLHAQVPPAKPLLYTFPIHQSLLNLSHCPYTFQFLPNIQPISSSPLDLPYSTTGFSVPSYRPPFPCCTLLTMPLYLRATHASCTTRVPLPPSISYQFIFLNILSACYCTYGSVMLQNFFNYSVVSTYDNLRT